MSDVLVSLLIIIIVAASAYVFGRKHESKRIDKILKEDIKNDVAKSDLKSLVDSNNSGNG